MKPTHPFPLFRLASLSLLFSGASIAADLAIDNASFENPPVAQEVFDVSPSDWSSYNGAAMGFEVFVYNPYIGETEFDDFTSPPPDGSQVLGIAGAQGGAGVTQQLEATFQADSQYSLSVKVGSSAYFNETFGFPGYQIQLVAGDTAIKTASGNTTSVELGEFITVNLTYDFDLADAPLDGEPLKIRLLSGGGSSGEVAFDDIELTAVLANPVADAGGPYYIANPADSLSLDASASLPSGNATITTYEWDLDNDGVFDDATGVTPAAISFANLQSLFGMVDGSNPVFLRVTDSDNKTAIAEATVELVTSTKYTGANGSNNDTWNVAGNWDNGIPSGDLDVVILSGKSPMVWSDSTPPYTGNLTLQNNASLVVGWTTARPGSYNGLGTPGLSKIIMNPGSSIRLRNAGAPVIPEIQLLADASFSLGESTQSPASAKFNYPITGPHTFTVRANNSNISPEFNASNSFSSLVISSTTTTGNQPTYRATVAGSLGLGNVTINTNSGNTKASELWIDANHAMLPTATLTINGDGPTGNQTNRLRIGTGVNITIAGLILNGTPLAAGTYGSSTSSAPNKLSWFNTAGTGTITIASPAVGYWDLNGTTAGAGSATPSGIWNASNAFWNVNEAGTGSVAAWTPGRAAIFSAGSDATGDYDVEVAGAQDISGLIIRDGSIDFMEGSGGALRITADSNMSIVSGSSIIATPITQSGTRMLSKSGSGMLTLTGALSQTGGTALLSGDLVLSGNNSAATGATTVTGGILRVDTPASIPGTARNATINSTGTLVFGSSFGSGNIQSALNDRIVATSAGTIAADNHASTNFDFSAAGFTAAYFGAIGHVNYTGSLTPNGSAYRLSGDGGGTLTMANTNALTGGRTLTARGNVILAADNDYTGATTVLANSSLALLGSTGTSGITLNLGSALSLGNNGSLGTGTLTLSGISTLQSLGTVVTTNPVSANADFVLSGTGDLTLGATTINSNRIITNAGSGTATFASITRDGSNNRALTIHGVGSTVVSGSLVLGTGSLTKNDGGTLTLQGANTYGATTINGGILRLEGSVFGAAATTVNAARLQLGGASNGGMASGNLTMNHPSAVLEAVGADRFIANNIILIQDFAVRGSHSLTVSGKMTVNNTPRTLSNWLSSSKVLTLGNVDLSQNTSNRTLTITGSGNTIIDGVIANGGGSTAGNLVKSGSGTLVLNGANTYAGTTAVNSGTLVVSGSTGSGNVTIASGATLTGTGIVAGNTTIATNGQLVFDINSDSANHDKLELASGKSLTFSGASTITITGTPDLDEYVLLTAPGGIFGTLPTLVVPDGWVAFLNKVGNDLVLDVDFTEDFPDPPTVVGIVDDQGGGPEVLVYVPVIYTVTFSEDMNATTVSSSDFGNAGTASITFGPISEPSPGVFTLEVTPTTAGSLRLRINQGASLRSAAGVNLNTTSAILDDTTLNAVVPVEGVLAVTQGDFMTSGIVEGPFSPSSKVYTLSNFGSSPLDWTAGKTAAWLDLDNPGGTLLAGATTTVTVSCNSSANSLPIGSYLDTLTFVNTTTPANTLTRNASLTVNGLPVQITLGNLYQLYDGTPKPVSVTTNPADIDYAVTYNGLAEVPTTAGLYEVVATITDPGYSGSASATLVIAKAPQTIEFAALDPVGNDETTLLLTASASSGLAVSFASSNSEVATVDGNTVTIIGVGTTTITASQPGDESFEPASDVERDLIVIRANPTADPGGPYTVSADVDLALDGTGSIASQDQTITAWEWDLDNDGIYDDGVTGEVPGTISMAILEGTHGMVGGVNTIRLRVTDSASKTSTVTTTVTLVTPLKWDANGLTAGRADGGGGWLADDRWLDGNTNQNWVAGRDADFGNGGAGGAVTLPVPTSVGAITFNTFTGTYTLGSSSIPLTINGGITKNIGSGVVALSSPLVLGGDQTWSNNDGALGQSSANSAAIDTGEFDLTIDGTGTTSLNRAVISGSGGVIKNGSGRLVLGTNPNAAHTFTGGLTINGGSVQVHPFSMSNVGPSNITINDGTLVAYWDNTLTRALGAGPGQFQILGGTSGFGGGNGGVAVRFTNNSNYEIVWGTENEAGNSNATGFFNPSEFVIGTAGSNKNFTIDNKIDLNGSTRTLGSYNVSPGLGILKNIIRNSSATPAGLIKVGPGQIALNAANTYNGGTTLQDGTLQLGNVSGLGSSVGTLTVNGGLLNLNNMASVTVGNLTGTGGTIANNGTGASTLTIGNGGGTGGNYQGVIANRTGTSTGTIALTKTGTGSITLSGNNTYTGATNINQGKLFINGSLGETTVTVASGATLGGTGTIGGNATIAANGKLEFNLSTPANGHDPLNIASGKTLAFGGASELTINVSLGAETGTYVLVTGGNNITGSAPATLNLPPGCAATVSIVGNELLLNLTEIGDIVPPTLVSIVDNQSGGPILIDTLVTYTVTFNEDIDAATVTAADFANAGSSAITIGAITETSPGVFTVQFTPTTAGTLQLRIPSIAIIQDMAGNALVTEPPLDDDTTIIVNEPPSDPFVVWGNGAGFDVDTNGDGIDNGLAWLLGAADPADNARDLLPVADEDTGNLTISFHTLRPDDRGTASIKVQYSKDMGVADLWTANEAEVPGESGTVNGIVFVIEEAGDFISVQATIPASAAGIGKKLFTRVAVTAP